MISATIDIRKDVAADSQHKTAYYKGKRWMTECCPALFITFSTKAVAYMSKTLDRVNIVQQICDAAELYRTHLVGKKFLYVFDGRYIEVMFKTKNFRHLTGIATTLSAKSFYSKAVQRKLTVQQIDFTSEHPYPLCVRKLKHLGQIALSAGSESFMLEEITTNTQRYKFGTTELNFSVCMNKEKDDNGCEIGDCYIAWSLRDEDCFDKSNNVYEVTHIFSKPNDQKEYSTLLYRDDKASNDVLPDMIIEMLNTSMQESFKGRR